MEKKHYKLKDDLKIGDLILVPKGNIYYARISHSAYYTDHYNYPINKKIIYANPNIFEPVKFYTEEGDPIFEDIKYWVVNKELIDYGEFISFLPPPEETKYFSKEENARAYWESLQKPKFEFNRWYRDPESKWLMFITSKTTGYGFNDANEWIDYSKDTLPWGEYVYSYPLAGEEEIKQRLLSYAKKHYPEGTKFKSVVNGRTHIIINTYKINKNSIICGALLPNTNRVFNITLYENGKWAELIEKPLLKDSTGKFWYKSDFKEGEVYYVRTRYEYIIRFKECTSVNIIGNSCLSTSSYSISYNNPTSSHKEIRPATQEEIKWLEKCEIAGKFVPKEEVIEKSCITCKHEKKEPSSYPCNMCTYGHLELEDYHSPKEDKSKFKVGDWIIANYSCGKPNYRGQIAKVISDSAYMYLDGTVEYNQVNFNFLGCKLATQEEIDKATKPKLTLGGLECIIDKSRVKVPGKGYIIVGTWLWWYDKIRAFKSLGGGGEITLTVGDYQATFVQNGYSNIGCVENITWDEIRKVTNCILKDA